MDFENTELTEEEKEKVYYLCKQQKWDRWKAIKHVIARRKQKRVFEY